jgi:hypothetical protein
VGEQCELAKIKGSKDKYFLRNVIEKNRRIN